MPIIRLCFFCVCRAREIPFNFQPSTEMENEFSWIIYCCSCCLLNNPLWWLLFATWMCFNCVFFSVIIFILYFFCFYFRLSTRNDLDKGGICVLLFFFFCFQIHLKFFFCFALTTKYFVFDFILFYKTHTTNLLLVFYCALECILRIEACFRHRFFFVVRIDKLFIRVQAILELVKVNRSYRIMIKPLQWMSPFPLIIFHIQFMKNLWIVQCDLKLQTFKITVVFFFLLEKLWIENAKYTYQPIRYTRLRKKKKKEKCYCNIYHFSRAKR